MGRAELFFVVLELCYVQHHIMNRDQLCTFAFVAMLMNISVPVSMSIYKPYYVKWTGFVPFSGTAHDSHDGHDQGAKHVEEGKGDEIVKESVSDLKDRDRHLDME